MKFKVVYSVQKEEVLESSNPEEAIDMFWLGKDKDRLRDKTKVIRVEVIK